MSVKTIRYCLIRPKHNFLHLYNAENIGSFFLKPLQRGQYGTMRPYFYSMQFQAHRLNLNQLQNITKRKSQRYTYRKNPSSNITCHHTWYADMSNYRHNTTHTHSIGIISLVFPLPTPIVYIKALQGKPEVSTSFFKWLTITLNFENLAYFGINSVLICHSVDSK